MTTTIYIHKLNAEAHLQHRDISAQTLNFYLQAIKQFVKWMVQGGRASESQLKHVKGVNVRTDRRHKLPGVKAFEGHYKRQRDKTACMLKADLAEAGIPYVDAVELYAD